MKSVKLNGKYFDLLIDEDEIKKIIRNLSKTINEDYSDKNPIVIAILDGAYVFAADLVRKFDFAHQFKFVKISSYKGMESTGQISLQLDLDISVEGEDILIIEDIVDTGVTLHQYLELLKTQNPTSIRICSFLMKPDAIQKPDLKINYCGKSIANEFVIGYGLDWDYRGRNYASIYQLRKES